jgi:hypothetical protein
LARELFEVALERFNILDCARFIEVDLDCDL